jgi:hypothetical protein
MNFIKNIDIFGEEFYFTIFGKSKYTTVLGGILTLLTGISTIIITILFGIDLIKRSNPKIVTERVIPSNYTYINCSLQNFPFFWRISDDNNLKANFKNVLYPELSLYAYYFNTNISEWEMTDKKSLTVKNCTKELVQNNDLFDQLGLNNYYCVDWTEVSYPLGGFWDGRTVYYFEMVINSCPGDDKSSLNCTTEDKLKKFLGSSNKIYYEIYYPQVFLSSTNFTHPIQTKLINFFQMLSPNLYKKNQFFFSETESHSDQGWIFTDKNKLNLITLDSSMIDIDIKTDEHLMNPLISSSIYSNIIYLTKDHMKYNLSYIKLQDVAAQVGGFIKIIMSFCYITSYHWNLFKKDLDVINKLFEFRKIGTSEIKIFDSDKSSINDIVKRKRPTSIFLIKSVFSIEKEESMATSKKINNYVSQFDNSINRDCEVPDIDMVKSAVMKYESDMDDDFRKFQLDFDGFIKYNLNCCFLKKTDKDNNKILDIGKKFLTMKLDLNYYLNMTDQITRLKCLLLKPYQIFLLDNQKKINLYSPKEKFDLDILDEHFSSENQIHLNIVQYLVQKLKENSFDQIDTILYEKLDTDLKHLIEDLVRFKKM